jgi:predicted pyridoxine 5'-phosphate oxidase superfamily flavin-nucleotide-binding protein
LTPTRSTPNAICATCVNKFAEDTMVIADNYFDKTRKDILERSKGFILFITREGKAFQIKGIIEYHKEGLIFEDMKRWKPKKHPSNTASCMEGGRGLPVLRIFLMVSYRK